MYTISSIDDIVKSMIAELVNVTKLLHGNKLTLTVAETTSMITATDRKLHESNIRELMQAHFKTLRKAIEQKKSVKYLGVILDNHMKWKKHRNLFSSKAPWELG